MESCSPQCPRPGVAVSSCQQGILLDIGFYIYLAIEHTLPF
jgi:hypothetical protein